MLSRCEGSLHRNSKERRDDGFKLTKERTQHKKDNIK